MLSEDRWDATAVARLADKFTVGDGCWEWTASRYASGYGQFRFNGRPRAAHRVVYELMVGPIPEGLQLDHLCRNRGCVRPDHLEPVTQAENIRRGEGIGSRARQTHCKWGHPFDAENTEWRNGGKWRACRTCRRRWARQ